MSPVKAESEKGFTLVELLFATVFFSFILIVTITGFIQVNRAFQKGQTVKRVQEDTRNTVDHIVRTLTTAGEDAPIQFCTPTTTPACGVNRLCIGNERYAWNVGPGNFLEDNDIAPGHESYMQGSPTGPKPRDFALLYTDDGANCTAPMPSSAHDALLDPRVAVGDFEVTQVDANGLVYAVSLTLSSNTADLLTSTTECDVTNGDQYCDTATLSTVVTLRN